ncbi:hypothetical protein Athai_05640 [Actinocatenispora thailandica]|uniref:Uncharacterized protein n=1 Tax=Actinocatenispora thailandica TaxID=227318 RepID=A0A7R7DKC4_9ACTN|nr:hypothetical protein Athai_05640 [Actinocatenispora thailandica]
MPANPPGTGVGAATVGPDPPPVGRRYDSGRRQDLAGSTIARRRRPARGGTVAGSTAAEKGEP